MHSDIIRVAEIIQLERCQIGLLLSMLGHLQLGFMLWCSKPI